MSVVTNRGKRGSDSFDAMKLFDRIQLEADQPPPRGPRPDKNALDPRLPPVAIAVYAIIAAIFICGVAGALASQAERQRLGSAQGTPHAADGAPAGARPALNPAYTDDAGRTVFP